MTKYIEYMASMATQQIHSILFEFFRYFYNFEKVKWNYVLTRNITDVVIKIHSLVWEHKYKVT